MNILERVSKLRQLMAENSIDAYIIPSADNHQSEYVGEYFKTRAYISGFTGSAGTVVITKDDAGLWTDGRYFIQADHQLEGYHNGSLCDNCCHNKCCKNFCGFLFHLSFLL